MQIEAIGNFIKTYMEVDEKNFKISGPLYISVRVLIDITKPLKRKMRTLRYNFNIRDSHHYVRFVVCSNIPETYFPVAYTPIGPPT